MGKKSKRLAARKCRREQVRPRAQKADKKPAQDDEDMAKRFSSLVEKVRSPEVVRRSARLQGCPPGAVTKDPVTPKSKEFKTPDAPKVSLILF